MNLARAIKTLRRRKGINMTELARLSGIGKGFLSDIEAGNRPNPTLSTVIKIAEGLSVTASQLIKLAEKEETKTEFGAVCPSCGNGRQVWVNQLTGKLTCHRWGCNNRELE